MILTAKKVFLILVFSFNLIHLPFVTAMFSFLVVWSVLGKKWAFIVFVITSIPDWIQSAWQTAYTVGPLVGSLFQANNCISLGQDFHNRYLIQPCITNIINLGPIGQFFDSFPKGPTIAVSIPLSFLLQPPYSLYWSIPALVIGIVYWIRQMVRIKNRIRRTIGGLWQFKPFKKRND